MTFPQLADWKATSWSLHQASMLLGPIHNAALPAQNNYMQLPMHVETTGLLSQKLPKGGRIHLNYKAQQVTYTPGSGDAQHFAFADHTQASLFEALLTALKADELADFFADVESDTLAAGLMAKLHANQGEFLKLEDVTHTDPLTVNAQTASDFADVFDAVYTGVARFRGRLTGPMTAAVVWPEHFDLSTLWFHANNTAMDANKAHLNFGFTPYTPDHFEFPYLYAYAYPFPESFDPPALKAPAFWHTEGFRAVVVNYADMVKADDPVAFVEQWCEDTCEALMPLLG